jgi:hypothetical protein
MKKLKLFISVLLILFLLILGMYIYLNKDQYSYIGTENYDYEDHEGYKLFKSEQNSKHAIIFFTGAKVDPLSYSKLFDMLRNDGIDVYALEFSFNMAFFSRGLPQEIENLESDIYLMGHSLGGTVMSSFVESEKIKPQGIIYLASYPSDTYSLKNIDVRALSIIGSEDGLISYEGINEELVNMPKDTTFQLIQGANHSGFGEYGHQKKDNESKLESDEQIIKTYSLIKDFIFK